VLKNPMVSCRVYAPVGAHRDLLAYLVRRLLENGANSSFVNQIVDEDVPPATVAACPLDAAERLTPLANPAIPAGPAIFGTRKNSQGYDLTDAADLAQIETARLPSQTTQFTAAPRIAGTVSATPPTPMHNPSTGTLIGHVQSTSNADVETALAAARPWAATPTERAKILLKAADLYEANAGPIFACLAAEAGKTLADAVGELREAVDFMRYYATNASTLSAPPRGIFTCISPWNFPLAIFSGQIAAALATGNAVLAKPAEQTPLIATMAIDLLHKAGVPKTALQLLPGDGAAVGAALTRDPRVGGVCFTGSTDTAQLIAKSMAEHLDPGTPLIAETGGLNAMLVDSTALPEQAVRDILASAFQSAGQRCSALRCLYVQEDVATTVQEMLFGAMNELSLGDPWHLSTDIGPVIDADAQSDIAAYIDHARAEGRVLHELKSPKSGTFIAPTVIRVKSIADMPREVFGPVLHIATFRAKDIGKVTAAINASNYGLTFGLHTRIDDRVQTVVEALHVGNIYVNRNQIGAVVGSQPFGGEGLSGTGPKAGGPDYMTRFTLQSVPEITGTDATPAQPADAVAALKAAPHHAVFHAQNLPGPTGESNRLSTYPRAPILCLGPTAAAALAQADRVRSLGGIPVELPSLAPEALATLPNFGAAIWWGDAAVGRDYAKALATRKGPILPLVTGMPDAAHVLLERHVCIDTTASGGNAQLLAEVGQT
jgi:RHH-type transcriptional regulator, proline utilization regulon repressor / proline dehydrogenase / delta 1-pyrroline-5-carboxylate dehydrogenase